MNKFCCGILFRSKPGPLLFLLLLALCANFAHCQVIRTAEIFTFSEFGSSPAVDMREFKSKLILTAAIGTRRTVFGRNALPFVSDGTPAGTVPLLEVDPDILRYTYLIEEYKAQYYFVSITTSTGGIFVTDGTPEGTTLVKELPSIAQPLFPYIFQEKLYFSLGSQFSLISQPQLWVTDGSNEGTFIVLSDVENPTYLAEAGGKLVFLADGDRVGERDLFVFDGGTEALPIFPGALFFRSSLAEYNGNVYFSASADQGSTYQLWITDGTDIGTRVVSSSIRSPRAFATVEGKLLFFASDPDGEKGIYSTTGADAAIVRILGGIALFGAFTEIGSTLYFPADIDPFGAEAWFTDGTQEGTSLLRDIVPDGSSFAQLFTQVNDKFYFITRPQDEVRELWTSDGSSEGTEMLRVEPEAALSDLIRSLVAFNGALFFNAGELFWKIVVDEVTTDPPSTPSTATTPASVAPVPSIDSDSECPAVPDEGCSICGDDLCVSSPDTIFTFPEQPNASCEVLQEAGYNGQISLDQCVFLPEFVNELCGCTDVVPTTLAPATLAPVVTAPTTRAPATLAPAVSAVSPELPPVGVPPVAVQPVTPPATATLAPAMTIPTTRAPITFPPATLPPVTLPPATLAPAMVAPIISPVGVSPVTIPPVTILPIAAPVTLAPVTLTPTTLAPVTLTPTTLTPTTLAPTTLTPVLSPELPPVGVSLVTPTVRGVPERTSDIPPAFAVLIDNRDRQQEAFRINRSEEREERREERRPARRDIFD